ncbi:RNaseH domain-containing protein [Streptomyces chrestomyceticus]|uniref:RNaseH domain-containing protein n=1 Tax=Streptomyces chrestomyceticus TaxID=68185 RepID=UPI0033C19465
MCSGSPRCTDEGTPSREQLRDRPTLLLADAGNLRQCWPGLRNGERPLHLARLAGQYVLPVAGTKKEMDT